LNSAITTTDGLDISLDGFNMKIVEKDHQKTTRE
jgi:hypothetical protein